MFRKKTIYSLILLCLLVLVTAESASAFWWQNEKNIDISVNEFKFMEAPIAGVPVDVFVSLYNNGTESVDGMYRINYIDEVFKQVNFYGLKPGEYFNFSNNEFHFNESGNYVLSLTNISYESNESTGSLPDQYLKIIVEDPYVTLDMADVIIDGFVELDFNETFLLDYNGNVQTFVSIDFSNLTNLETGDVINSANVYSSLNNFNISEDVILNIGVNLNEDSVLGLYGGVYTVSYDNKSFTKKMYVDVKSPRIILNSIEDSFVYENTFYSKQIQASSDYGFLMYQLVDAPLGMQISKPGEIMWQAKNSSVNNVTYRVTNGYETVEDKFVLSVVLDEFHIAPISDKTIYLKQEFTKQVSVENANGDVSFSLLEKPEGMIISSEGLISWTPLDIINYTVIIQAQDELSVVNESFDIVVKNKNPVIETISEQSFVIDQEFRYQVVANDPENETLSYEILSGPTGMSITSTGLILGWTPTVSGNYDVSVRVSDVHGGSDDESFSINARDHVYEIDLVGDISLGSDDQERNKTDSFRITIKNTGTENLENIRMKSYMKNGQEFGNEFSYVINSGNTQNLAAGNSMELTISYLIPFETDSERHEIGSLRVEADSGNGIVSDTGNIYLEAKSYLKLYKLIVDVDGDEETISDGEEIEVEADDEITLKVTLENLYDDSDDEDIELEDVYFEIEADENDWDFIDDESDEDDIDADERTEFKMTFKLDELDDIDDEETTVKVSIYGTDGEYGFEHYDELEFKFSYDQKKDNIVIDEWELSKNPVDCHDGKVYLDVVLKNTGSDDQESAGILVKIDDGVWNFFKHFFKLLLYL